MAQFLFLQENLRSNLRVSSLQGRFASPAESNVAPESCRLFRLRSNSFKVKDWELKIEDRVSQLLSDTLQPLSLKESLWQRKTNIVFIVYNVKMFLILKLPYSNIVICKKWIYLTFSNSYSRWLLKLSAAYFQTKAQ